MKKLIIAAAFILLAGTAFSQSLKKGVHLGIQSLNITLAADVTMEQYLDFMMNTVLPEYEKHFPGLKVFIMAGGMELGSSEEAEVKYSTIYYFESDEVQSKYFDSDFNLTDEGNAGWEKLEPTIEKLEKLGTNSAPTPGWLIL
jgi:hypothetical protein